MKQQPITKYRGVIDIKLAHRLIEKRDYSFIYQQKQGYFFSYETDTFQFHVVDRFASFPLYYLMKNGVPIVSQDIDELIPFLKKTEFDPIGFYCTGEAALKGERTAHTPFKGIKRIMPGHYLVYEKGVVNFHCYWSFEQLKKKKFKGNYNEACETLGKLIKQSVHRCKEFAPTAAIHLSGGLDSGTIAGFICEYSNQPQKAFAHSFSKSEAANNSHEISYLPKYKKHFPQLDIESIQTQDLLSKSDDFIEGAGNWHCITNGFFECKIAQKATKSHHYIFTGLGGDELASYGHISQNVRHLIHNDFQLMLHQLKEKKKTQFVQRIKYMLGYQKKTSIEAFRINNITRKHEFWHKKSYIKSCRKYFNKPILIPYLIPASYSYRLKVLSRSHFTYRSDFWNYIGMKYGIDYIHPLLDSDLVEFCASLPPSFFRRQAPRNMFKIAVKESFPAELLTGSKRPTAPIKVLSNDELIKIVTSYYNYFKNTKAHFAGLVYNLDSIISELREINDFLNQSKELNKQLNSSIQSFLFYTKITYSRCEYLNRYFG